MSVLTPEEQKLSLSSKKKKKKTFKSILDTYDDKPSVYAQETDEIVNLISGVLSNEAKKDLVLGINAVNRRLRANSLKAVFVAKDIQPPHMLRSIVLYGHRYNIPVIHIPSLRRITRKAFCFESIAVGLTKSDNVWTDIVLEAKKMCPQLSTAVINPQGDSNSDEEVMVVEIETVSSLKRVDSDSRLDQNYIAIKDNLQGLENSAFGLKGISSTIIKKSKMAEKEQQGVVSFPRVKKDWIFDTSRSMENMKYLPPKVIRTSSNLNRKRRKK